MIVSGAARRLLSGMIEVVVLDELEQPAEHRIAGEPGPVNQALTKIVRPGDRHQVDERHLEMVSKHFQCP